MSPAATPAASHALRCVLKAREVPGHTRAPYTLRPATTLPSPAASVHRRRADDIPGLRCSPPPVAANCRVRSLPSISPPMTANWSPLKHRCRRDQHGLPTLPGSHCRVLTPHPAVKAAIRQPTSVRRPDRITRVCCAAHATSAVPSTSTGGRGGAAAPAPSPRWSAAWRCTPGVYQQG